MCVFVFIIVKCVYVCVFAYIHTEVESIHE